MKHPCLGLALAVLSLVGCAVPAAIAPDSPEPIPLWTARADSKPLNRVLLKASSANAAASAIARVQGRKVDEIRDMGVTVVELPGAVSALALSRMRGVAGVDYVELDGVITADAPRPKGTPKPSPSPSTGTCQPGFPNDAEYTAIQQWGLFKIQAPQAWALQPGVDSTSTGAVTIAILDTGIDQNHPDLDANASLTTDGGKIVKQANFTTTTSLDDMNGHGTHCAGVAAALSDNCQGIAGVAMDAKLMNVKVMDDAGSGYYSWLINGLNYAVANGAKVVSLSLSGSVASTTLETAINNAVSRGVLVVAAAGNSGSSTLRYPAAYAGCLAVGASDYADGRASFSNYGPSWVDVAAPGVGIYSTLPNHANRSGSTHYGSMSGTSMATPLVAGVAAVLWPQLGNGAAVRQRLESTAFRSAGLSAWVATGRVDLYRAVTNTTN